MLSLLLPLLLFAQQRVPLAPAGRSATIAGTVIHAESRQPIPGAQITLHPSDITTVTDSTGRFRVSVAAGRQTLTVERSGLVLQADPLHAITETGMTLTLNTGENNSNIVLPMIAAPVISGHTFFPSGEPLAAAAVRAYRRRITPSGPRLKITKTVLTDDTGAYRIFGIGFGDYLVSASYSHRDQQAALGKIRLSPNVPDPDDGYATIFYRSTTDVADAQRVRVAPGTAQDSLDIILSDVPRLKIRGRVISPGALPPDLKVIFVPRGGDLKLDNTDTFVGTSADGSFQIPNVVPGSYSMLAFGGALSSDIVSVIVGETDAENVTIPLKPTFQISGRISGVGIPLSPRTKVQLIRTTREVDLAYEAVPSADGSFTLFNVGQGDYDVFVEPVPADEYIRSIRYGARDVLSVAMRVGTDPNTALDIQFSTNNMFVRGKVVDSSGMPAPGVQVVLVPEVRFRKRPDRYIVDVTDAAGAFQINTIPPGRYSVFAFERIEPDAYYAFAYDPAVERRFANRATLINPVPGEYTTVELKLIPASETAAGL